MRSLATLALPLAALLAAACADGPDQPTTDTGGTSTDTGSDTGTPDDDTGATDDDTGLPVTDDDGDGWGVEQGDCDDDEVFVNPAMPEGNGQIRQIDADGIDNDCDGRIDETFLAAGVVNFNVGGGTAGIVSADVLGSQAEWSAGLFIDAETPVGFSATVVEDPDFEHWAMLNSGGRVYRFGLDGDTELLLDLSEYEWPPGDDPDNPDMGPPGYYNIGLHPDGGYLVAAADRLLHVRGAGDWSMVAKWVCDPGDPEANVGCVTAIATSRDTGTVYVLDAFGGFGTWTQTGGIAWEVEPDLSEGADVPFFNDAQVSRYTSTQGGVRDTVWAMADRGGKKHIYRWRPGDDDAFAEPYGVWPQPLDSFAPLAFSVDEISEELWFAVRGPQASPGSEFQQIWKMEEDGASFARLFGNTEPRDNKAFLYGAPFVIYGDKD